MSAQDNEAKGTRQEAFSLQRFLMDFDRIGTHDERHVATLFRHKEEVVPALLAMITETFGTTKLQASLLLLHLGETAGTQGLIELLSEPNYELRRHTLTSLSLLPYHRDRGGLQVPLDQDAVFAAVDPLIETSDTAIRTLAIRVIDRLRTPASGARMAALITHPAVAVRVESVKWLAHFGDSRRALTALNELLFSSELEDVHRYWLIMALEDLCASDAAEIRQQASHIAMKYARANLEDDDNSIANHVWHCLTGIAAVAPPDESKLLQEILASKLAWWVRGIALERLAELEGAPGLERLCAALKDRQLRKAAADALGKQARGSHEPRIVQALAEALEDAQDLELSTTIIQAMLTVGTPPRSILERAMSRVNPNTAMALHWIFNDIKPRRLAQLLVAADIFEMLSKAELAKYSSRWREERDAASVLFEMLATANRLSDFSCKTGEIPADHAELLQKFARICPPTLTLTDAFQTIEPEDGGRCRVSFMLNGRAHSFVAENRGRYYDLQAVMAGLNAALGNIGHRERFFQLYTGGEAAIVTLAVEEPFLAAVRELRIPLEEDPGSAEQAGIAYTNHVISTAGS
jgi:hypothetical protein